MAAWHAAEALIKRSDASRIPQPRTSASKEETAATSGRPSAHDIDDTPSTSSSLFNSQLLWWDEVPQVLQYNKYIRSGYRAGLSKRQCLCSIFQYHNETGNILTHLIPGLLLLLLLLSEGLPAWPHAKLAFLESVVPSLLCFAGSVCYHTLMANHWHYHTYLRLDMCGVFLVMICGAGSGISWGLQCHPVLKHTLLVSYYMSAVACVFAGLRAKSQFGRAGPMMGLLLIRLIAVLSRWVLNSGPLSAIYYYLAMEVTSIAGALVNMFRIPERWLFPKGGPEPCCRKAGIFDYWLNSHQLMHILVVFAMAFKYLGTAADYRHRLEERVGCF